MPASRITIFNILIALNKLLHRNRPKVTVAL